MGSATDQEIWDRAAKEEFTILSKDTDFIHRSLLYGHPPRVIWLALGNCTTEEIKATLDGAEDTIEQFEEGQSRSILVLP